jgi:hypothetical protein
MANFGDIQSRQKTDARFTPPDGVKSASFKKLSFAKLTSIGGHTSKFPP